MNYLVLHEDVVMERDDAEQEQGGHGHTRATACVVNIIRTAELLQAQLAEVLRPHGLSLNTANVLAILAGAGEPLPPHVISERLLVTRGAVTQLLDVLEKRSFVRRINHPQDRRMLLIELTEEGWQSFRTWRPLVAAHDGAWMATLNGAEQERLVNLLHKIQVQLGHVPSQDT